MLSQTVVYRPIAEWPDPVSAAADRYREFMEAFWTWHPEIRWSPATAGARRTYVGHDGMRRWFGELFARFDGLRFEDAELCEAGDRVLALYTLRGRDGQTGGELVQPEAALWRFASGKVVQGRGFASHEEGLRASTGCASRTPSSARPAIACSRCTRFAAGTARRAASSSNRRRRWRFSSGKVVEGRGFASHEEGLRAVGFA